MGDFTVGRNVAPLAIGTFTPNHTNTDELRSIVATTSSALTWVANLAIYVPFSIPFQFPVRRLWWFNGSTIGSNTDMGVFSLDGEKIVSAGSTAQAGTTAIQYVTPTETLLPPGAYYFGLVNSGTTARIQGTASYSAQLLRGFTGTLQEALAGSTLPARMTPVAIANALYPYCGMSQTLTGF